MDLSVADTPSKKIQTLLDLLSDEAQETPEPGDGDKDVKESQASTG